MKLATRLDAVKPSPTLAVTAKANEMKAKGIDVVGFGAGEPDFDTPLVVKDAAKKALDQGFTKYTPTAGIQPLREAIAARIEAEHRLKYQAKEVLVSCGGKHALYNLFQALLEPGDEVVIFTPYWVSYADMVRVAGGVPVLVETSMDTGFDPSVEQVERAFTPKTRAVIVNSPSNPTGAMLSRRTLETVIRCVKGKDVLVVSDDIYDHLVYRGKFENVLDLDPSLQGQVALVNGASKTFAMTGWRIGYMANRLLAPHMGTLITNTDSCAPHVCQKAVVEGLTGPQDDIQKMVKTFKERRDVIVDGLNSLPGFTCLKPGGAFYVWPNVTEACKVLGAKDSEELRKLLLYEAGVACLADIHFGPRVPDEGQHIRFSYASSTEDIQEGISRIRKLLGAKKH